MSAHRRQPDLFAEPEPAEYRAPPQPPLAPPYTLEELTALGEQLRAFDRVPDDWIPGWWTMHNRACDTLRQVPREQRDAYRAVYFAEANRLIKADYDDARAEREKAQAEAEAAAEAEKKVRRSAARKTGKRTADARPA